MGYVSRFFKVPLVFLMQIISASNIENYRSRAVDLRYKAGTGPWRPATYYTGDVRSS